MIKDIVQQENNNTMKDKLRDLRKGLIVLENTIKKIPANNTVSIILMNLESSRMWLGNTIKHYTNNKENPYAENDGKRKTVEDIKPLYDKTDYVLHSQLINNKEYISLIDKIREEIQFKINDVDKAQQEIFREVEKKGINMKDLHYMNISFFNTISRLIESRMWLGSLLGKIRDNENYLNE